MVPRAGWPRSMHEHDWLAEQFEENRTHLRAVAYRMLGSLSEADDAVQDAWLRLSRSDTGGVENLGGWPRVVFGFTITRGKIVGIDLVANPAHLRQLDLTALND